MGSIGKQPSRLTNFSKRLLILISAVVVTCVLLGAGTCALITRNLCGDDLVREQRSPNGRYVAGVFERNCGATTPFFYHVNLRRADDKFRRDWEGTVKQGEIYTSERNSVTFEWVTDGELKVYGKDPLQHAKWRDVTIVRAN